MRRTGPPRFRGTIVNYRQRRDGTVRLNIPVWVPDGDGWEKRARRTALLIGALHFHLYDLDGGSHGS